MSALPPKADIGRACRDVRFVPKADIHRLIRLPGFVTKGPSKVIAGQAKLSPDVAPFDATPRRFSNTPCASQANRSSELIPGIRPHVLEIVLLNYLRPQQ